MLRLLPKKVLIRSFGINIQLESDDSTLLEESLNRTRRSLLNKIEIIESAVPDHVFGFYVDTDGVYVLRHNGEDERHGENREYFLRFFDTWLRLTVSEYAKDRVFLHSGAVAWRGKGIIFPGQSHAGKSTLTAALVDAGATYYSDEYAILDENALLHPFPRPISLRVPESAEFRELFVSTRESATSADSIEIACVIFTNYDPVSQWKPQSLTPGQAILELVSHTAPIRYNPIFSLKVLKTLVSNAILIKSDRNDVGQFVGQFLDFFDKSAF
jgi:hypothetical protein